MGQVTLNPATWDAAEVHAYLGRSAAPDASGPVTGAASHAMVLGAHSPLAQLAGRRALELGGSAADAVLTTALTEIALAAGCVISYAGIFTMVYFEATTGRITSLSAGFGAFRDETAPMSIPPPPEPSGRTALVPGFLAGVEAAHTRFGRLPWADLFQPAIFVAEHGFSVTDGRAEQFRRRTHVLGRLPEGRAIFFNADGTLPEVGDIFRQPTLADTLRRVAAEGTAYIYRGPWAAAFVEQVRRAGGRATLEDLAVYRPHWSAPLQGSYAGHDVYSLGGQNTGGARLIEALHLVEEANLGDPATSWEALFWLIQISRQGNLLRHVPVNRRVTRAYAQQVWRQMRAHGGAIGSGRVPSESHSDFVLAVDATGNVAAICHSSNTFMWSNTGLFVGGVSIPDAATYRQADLRDLEPGAHLPSQTNPTIVTRDGVPLLASSSIGVGMHAVTLECLVAILGRGMPLEAAVRQPLFHGPDFGGDARSIAERRNEERRAGTAPQDIWPNVLRRIPEIVENTFDAQVLAQVHVAGLPLRVTSAETILPCSGFWGGISIGARGTALRGGRTGALTGAIEAL